MPSFVKVAAHPPGRPASGHAAAPSASTAAATERPSPPRPRGPPGRRTSGGSSVAAAAARALLACDDDSDSDGYETADDGDGPRDHGPGGGPGGDGAPSSSDGGGATAETGGGRPSPPRADGGSDGSGAPPDGWTADPTGPSGAGPRGAGDGEKSEAAGLDGGTTGDGPPPKRMRGEGDAGAGGPSTPAPAGGGTPGRTVPRKPGKPFRSEAKVDRAEVGKQGGRDSAPEEPTGRGDKKEVIEIHDDDDDEDVEEMGPMEEALFLAGRGKTTPWPVQWAAMRSRGWVRHPAAGSPPLPADVYVRPSTAWRTRSQLAANFALEPGWRTWFDSVRGRDYFMGAEEAKAYARREMGWVEGEAAASGPSVATAAARADGTETAGIRPPSGAKVAAASETPAASQASRAATAATAATTRTLPRVPVHKPASARTAAAAAAAAAQTLRNARAGGTETSALARPAQVTAAAPATGARAAAATAAARTLRNARAGGTETAADAPAATRAPAAAQTWDGALGRWVPLDPGRETQSTFYQAAEETRRNSREGGAAGDALPAPAGTLPPSIVVPARAPPPSVVVLGATVINNNKGNGGVRRAPAGPPAPSHRQPVQPAMATVIGNNGTANANGGVRPAPASHRQPVQQATASVVSNHGNGSIRQAPPAASHRQPPPQFTRHPQDGQRRTTAASAPAPPGAQRAAAANTSAESRQSRLRERFSERRIDECATVPQLEAARRRLLRLVDRVDVRLREARVGEALAAYAGGSAAGDEGRVDTAVLVGRVERQLAGGGVPSGSDKTDEEKEEEEEEEKKPTCCPLCLAPDPSDTVTCAVCDEGDVCPECTYRCPACGRDVCADCAVSPEGPSDGPGTLCSDCRCMNARGATAKGANASAGGRSGDTLLPARRRGQQQPHRQHNQQQQYTSVLQSANRAVGVPHEYPAAPFAVPPPAAAAVPLAARGSWTYYLQQQHARQQPAGHPRQQQQRQHPQAPGQRQHPQAPGQQQHPQAPRQQQHPQAPRQPPRHIADAIKAAGDARRSAVGKRKAPAPLPTADPPPSSKRRAPGPSTAPPQAAAACAQTSASDPMGRRVYSVHRFVVTSTSPGPLGMSMCLRPPSVSVTDVKPGTLASRLGVRRDDEITHQSESSGPKALYDSFVSAAGRRPLTFEVRRPQWIQTKGDGSGVVRALHRFVIREEGRIGVVLNKTPKDLSVVSTVAPGSLAEFYGIRPNDVLARPGTEGKTIMGVFDEIKGGIIGGTRPVVIEVWRSVPQSSPPLCSVYDFNAEVPWPRREPDRPAPQCAARTADAGGEDPSRPPEPAKSRPADAPPARGGPGEGGAAPRVAADGPSARAPSDGTAGRGETDPRGPTRKSPSRRAKTASAAKREEEVVELLTSEDDASERSSGEDSDYTLT